LDEDIAVYDGHVPMAGVEVIAGFCKKHADIHTHGLAKRQGLMGCWLPEMRLVYRNIFPKEL